MMTASRDFKLTALTTLLLLLPACVGGSMGTVEIAPAPRIEALSGTQVEVGSSLELEGTNFPDRADGWVDVHFRGEYRADDGSVSPVDFTVALQANDGVLTWDSFGAYRIPFGNGHQLGTFVGEIRGTARLYDGSYTESTDRALLAQLQVLPSIVVRDFRAMGDGWYADCKEPSTTILHGATYGMRVQAVGFTPERVDFVLSPGWLVDNQPTTDTTSFTRESSDLEQGILLRAAPLPDFVDGFAASVLVRMTDTEGHMHSVTYPVIVRRPLEVYWRTRMEIAEILPAEPVSGCIPGGMSSVSVEYSESVSETRTRTSQRSLSNNWTETVGTGHTDTYGSSLSEGSTEIDGHEVTVTDGTSSGGSTMDTNTFTATEGRTAERTTSFTDGQSDTVGWSVGRGHTDMNNTTVGVGVTGSTTVTATAEASTGFLPGGKVGGSVSGTISMSGQYQRGWGASDTVESGEEGSHGTMSSSTTGSSQGTSASTSEANSRAVGTSWDRSQSYAEQNSFSHAVSRETTSSYQQAVQRNDSIANSLGSSETEIYSVSTTEATSLRTQASVWAGQYGVWYRQTTRMMRFGTVVAYDLCGNGDEVGRVSIDDWRWAPDLAIGQECAPPSNFPQPECRIPPCGGH